MFVKICGITRAEDAAAAVALGASAVGFIFWPGSPRFIDPYHARRIAAALPPFVTPVGVFVNEPPAHVNAVAGLVGLGAVQLHGEETPDVLPFLRHPVVKALTRVDQKTASEWPAHVLMMIDAEDRVRRGGTGARADWQAAAGLGATRPVLLAGGIGPGNVLQAIEAVRPFGVDVSSAVERSPGVKDHDRLRELFDTLRAFRG
ncbi:MAG: N-(5'-phosphoribosyl)anthranilate isomerase [Vicinamibacterales bacterium]